MKRDRECCDYCMWLGPVNQDGTMRKHRPATRDDKWGRPNMVQDMDAAPCPGSHKPYARFGCEADTPSETTQESTMTEYGVFEDGACIEAGFHGEAGKAAAEEHVASLVAADPDMADAYEVAEICPDHDEQPKNGCEECAEGEAADDSDAECSDDD